MRQLYMMNLPYNSTDSELKEWIELRGVRVSSLKIIRDLLSQTSPCFACVEIEKPSDMDKAIAVLDDQAIRGQRIAVSEVDLGTSAPACRTDSAAA